MKKARGEDEHDRGESLAHFVYYAKTRFIPNLKSNTDAVRRHLITL